LLSFEITDDGKAIQIHCDWEGLTRLRQRLDEFVKLGGHIHLRSPGAGGKDLDDLNPWDQPAIPEVIITGGGDDWPDK
jgi:hypothetical protein